MSIIGIFHGTSAGRQTQADAFLNHLSVANSATLNCVTLTASDNVTCAALRVFGEIDGNVSLCKIECANSFTVTAQNNIQLLANGPGIGDIFLSTEGAGDSDITLSGDQRITLSSGLRTDLTEKQGLLELSPSDPGILTRLSGQDANFGVALAKLDMFINGALGDSAGVVLETFKDNGAGVQELQGRLLMDSTSSGGNVELIHAGATGDLNITHTNTGDINLGAVGGSISAGAGVDVKIVADTGAIGLESAIGMQLRDNTANIAINANQGVALTADNTDITATASLGSVTLTGQQNIGLKATLGTIDLKADAGKISINSSIGMAIIDDNASIGITAGDAIQLTANNGQIDLLASTGDITLTVSAGATTSINGNNAGSVGFFAGPGTSATALNGAGFNKATIDAAAAVPANAIADITQILQDYGLIQ